MGSPNAEAIVFEELKPLQKALESARATHHKAKDDRIALEAEVSYSHVELCDKSLTMYNNENL